MSPGPENKTPDTESEIWNAISAFERILEVMPDDRTSLETLVHAYTQLGDHTRARDYLIRLAKVAGDENDDAAAGPIIEQLKPFAETDPTIHVLIDRLGAMIKKDRQAVESPEKKATASTATAKAFLQRKVNISDELSFAWDLLQAGELTQEQYAEVVQDLTDISSNTADQGAVSMLQVIENRGFGNMDRILVFAARKGETPIIFLSNFELTDEAVAFLPLEFMIRLGVLPFDILGPDALVAIQNTYDRELRKGVEQVIGRHCHFFLTPPGEFNAAINRIVKKNAETAAKAPK